jgi:hypothetical protein
MLEHLKWYILNVLNIKHTYMRVHIHITICLIYMEKYMKIFNNFELSY